MQSNGYKRVPVIDTDYCLGCGLCAKACDRGCIEMVWDFATFKCAEVCGSCGTCAQSCPHDVIRMDWVPATGDRSIGEWRDSPPAPARAEAETRSKGWLFGLFAKRPC